ncbi:uncharacterized protein KD926_008385 [Aspergillus affinis]|uniref:uncharacterized protein n=1 Tax=Aspergillus affinis TaxID=1070780 RepID=UPI0022FDDD48|nr:uncharacterized protein KD926_008385 [Aspergillus affinis]KAI9040295.1 hypothetical protein KD926_008385 [Aspergillus affinis]
MCADVGVKLIYLPPYAPDLNPIEEFFAELKSFIKRHWSYYENAPDQGFDVFLEWSINIATRQNQRATGFVGAYLLHQLLSMPSVKKVACLARSRGYLTANDRIQKALEKYDLWDGRLESTQKIITLDGDLTDVTLGLGEDKFNWLSNWASVIFHIGVRVNWCEPYDTH